MKEKVLKSIEEEKIIVIVRGVQREKLISLCEAMYEGGIRILELTYEAGGKTSDEETAENIKMLSEKFEGRMYIGAGTVLTKKQVMLTKKVGGQFIVSPNTDKAVIKKTVKLGMVSIPGALTPTEVKDAYKFGADFVKLFPVSSMGADYVKAIKAPFSNIKLTAFGGINEKNIPEYIDAGISGFGIGANIVDKNLIDNDEFDKISELARKYVDVIKGQNV